MANIATITLRSAVTTQALATMGVDPEWDRLLTKYLATEALLFADEQFGELNNAGDKYALEEIRNPEPSPRLSKAFDELDDAQAAWSKRYCEPFWKAGRQLAKYPAPTLAAALFKVAAIGQHEIWNDSDLIGDCMQIVTEDMARLAA